MYYRPEIGVAADVIPFWNGEEFQLLYLHDFRNKEKYGEGCTWDLVTTKDFITYHDNGVAIKRGKPNEQDLFVFTGSVIRKNEEYYVFYTGHNPYMRKHGMPEQKILLAKGKTLLSLVKQKEFVFSAPPFLEEHDFRDPFVFFDENEQNYKMLIAARKKEGPLNHRGVTMIAVSDDLITWEIEETPFFAPDAYYTHECPDLFRIGDWYYLVFSEFTDRFVTRYRYSKTLHGPWLAPENDIFDSHAFYAAKTVSNEKKRFLIGWNPIKDEENDFGSWQWGGNIIVHELVQNANGSLSTKMPDEICHSYNQEVSLKEGKCFNFTLTKKGYKSDPTRFCYTLFDDIPHACKIDIWFKTGQKIRDFGIALRIDDELQNGYYLKIEPLLNRMSLDKRPRKDVTVPIMADLEKYISFSDNHSHHLSLVLEGSVAVAYVDNQASMCFRMFDHIKGKLGIYSNCSDVIFLNIVMNVSS